MGKNTKKNTKRNIIAAILVLFCVLAGWMIVNRGGGPPRGAEFQKGMCYATWSLGAYSTAESDKSLERLKALGVNWVAILATWYQDKCYSTEIKPGPLTSTDEGVVRAIKKAHSLGMKVMMKPHLDILDISDGSWRGDIACVIDSDWKIWFDSYKRFALHYARICRDNKVEMYCIGTELSASTVTREADWRDVIAAVRKVYKRPLTYAANWNDEYLDIRFWDALDYAGVDAYFPLSSKEIPALEELKEGWVKWAHEVEVWQEGIKKPVIFPEVGYHSADGAAITPWTHETPGKVNLQLQRDCYAALMETFWDKKWFYGIYWWKWGTNVEMGGRNSRDFTPQNKPAEDIVKEWYQNRAVGAKGYK